MASLDLGSRLLLVVATFSVLTVVCRGQFVRGLNTKTLVACGLQGKKLKGSVIKPLTETSILRCAMLCLTETTCASMNWKKTTSLCELNSSDKTTNAANLATDAEFFYWAPDNCAWFTPATTTTTTTQAPFQCTSPMKLVSGTCLFLESGSMKTWADAETACKAKSPAGTWDLLTVEAGKAFYDAITSQLFTAANENKNFWIGMRRADATTWKWTDPGSTTVTVENDDMWFAGQTTGDPKVTCGSLVYQMPVYGSIKGNGYKRDEDCSNPKGFICMKRN